MQPQAQQRILSRQLSQQETSSYFLPNTPVGGYIAIIIGILVFGIAVVFLVKGLDVPYDFIAMAIGVLIAGLGLQAVDRARKTKPTDTEYDSWQEEQAKALYRRGLWDLGIERSEVSGQVLSFHSYVLPGSQAAEEYDSKDVQMRSGEDGKWRYSVNVYTYFVPTANFIGILMFDINAFDHKAHSRSYMHHTLYAYKNIRKVTRLPTQDTVLYQRKQYPCQVEKLGLTIFDGVTTTTQDMSAAVTARFTTGEGNYITLTPTINFERKINQLRRLLIPPR